MQMNVIGVCEMIELCKGMKKLEVISFQALSHAISNCCTK